MNKIRILFKKKNGSSHRSGESSVNDGQMSCEKLCDRPDWPSCGPNTDLPELIEQIDHISSLIKNIYENSQITLYDKKLQERLSKGRQALELLENECKYMNRNVNALKFQLQAVKDEKVKIVKLIPLLMEEDRKETDQVLQRCDVFLHARWGVLRHSKNAKKLESFLLDIMKRHTNLVNMEKSALNPSTSKVLIKIEHTKVVPVLVEAQVPAKPNKPPTTLSINPLNIKRIPRPYKRRRQQEAPITVRNPLLPSESKNGIVLYPIEELERQQRLAAQIEKQHVHNFNSVVLPIEYVDLTQDLPMNAPVRTEPGPVNVNRDSTSNTSLSSNIHSEISCMMQALFGESASTTSINMENLTLNVNHNNQNQNLNQNLNMNMNMNMNMNQNLFLSDNEPMSDTDVEDASGSNR